MQQADRIMSSIRPVATVDTSPKELHRSQSTERSLGKDGRFGESLDSCCCSTPRLPVRSNSTNSNESKTCTKEVSETRIRSTQETVTQSSSETDSKSRQSVKTKLTDSLESTGSRNVNQSNNTMEFEGLKNVVVRQKSSDCNTSKHSDDSVFSFTALRPTMQSIVVNESTIEGNVSTQRLDLATDRFRMSISSESIVCMVLKAPTRSNSENSNDNLRSMNEQTEHVPFPTTIDVTSNSNAIDEVSLNRKLLELHNGSSHDRFVTSMESERCLSLKPPVRSLSTLSIGSDQSVPEKSTESLNVCETACGTSANDMKVVHNRLPAALISEIVDTNVRSQSGTMISDDVSKKNQCHLVDMTLHPSSTTLDLNDASMSLESVFPDILCNSTLLTSPPPISSATKLGRSAKSSGTISTIASNSRAENDPISINEDSNALSRSSERTNGPKRRSTGSTIAKEQKRLPNPLRTSMDHVKSTRKSSVKKVGCSNSKNTLSQPKLRIDVPSASKDCLDNMKIPTEIGESSLNIDCTICQAVIDTEDVGTTTKVVAKDSLQRDKSRRQVKNAGPQSNERRPSNKGPFTTDSKTARSPSLTNGSSKQQFVREQSKKQTKTGEKTTIASTFGRDTSPPIETIRRTELLEKSSMVLPRDDSRLRPREKNPIETLFSPNTFHHTNATTALPVQLSSSTMQRDESQRRMKSTGVKTGTPNNLNIATKAPPSSTRLDRDESQRRVKKSNQSEMVREITQNDSDAINFKTSLFQGQHTPSARPDVKRKLIKKSDSPASNDLTENIQLTKVSSLPTRNIRHDESRRRIGRNQSSTKVTGIAPGLVTPPETYLPNETVPATQRDTSRRNIKNEEISSTEVISNESVTTYQETEKTSAFDSLNESSSILQHKGNRISEKQELSSSARAIALTYSTTATNSRIALSGLPSLSVLQRDESRLRTRIEEQKPPVDVAISTNRNRRMSNDSISSMNSNADIHRDKSQKNDVKNTIQLAKEMKLEESRTRVTKSVKNEIKRSTFTSNSDTTTNSTITNGSTSASHEKNSSISNEYNDRRPLRYGEGKSPHDIQFSSNNVDDKNPKHMPYELNDGNSRSEVLPPESFDNVDAVQLVNSYPLTSPSEPYKVLHRDASQATDEKNDVSSASKLENTSRQRSSSYTGPIDEKKKKILGPLNRTSTHGSNTQKSSVRSSELTKQRSEHMNYDRKPEPKHSNPVASDNSSHRSIHTSISRVCVGNNPTSKGTSIQNKATLIDHSDSSSDPSLPDRDVDFVILRMVASKRNLMSKYSHEQMSARFNIDPNNGINTTGNMSGAATPKSIRDNRYSTGGKEYDLIATSNNIQKDVDDSKSMTIFTTTEQQRSIDSTVGHIVLDGHRSKSIRHGTNGATDICTTTNTCKSKRNTSNGKKLKSTEELDTHVGKLITRHLRRLVEPNDRQLSRRGSSHTNGHASCCSQQSSSSDLGGETISSVAVDSTDYDDDINVTSRRLSIRQQRLPRRHFSKFRVVPTSSALGSDQRKGDQMNVVSHTVKVDMMPQRPSRRLSQSAPLILASLQNQQQQPTPVPRQQSGTKEVSSTCSLIGRMSSCEEEGSESLDEKDTRNGPKIASKCCTKTTNPATSSNCGPQTINPTTTAKCCTKTMDDDATTDQNDIQSTDIQSTVSSMSISLMMNSDGAMEDLFTHFFWSTDCCGVQCCWFTTTTTTTTRGSGNDVVGTMTGNNNMKGPRQELRNRIHKTPLHSAMERYYKNNHHN